MTAEEKYRLAMRYIYGDGVEEDNAIALRLLTEAYEQGHVEAAYNLGICYHDGYGTAADLVRARELYRFSAERGCGKGQNLMTLFCLEGLGAPQNLLQARCWLEKSLTSGEPEVLDYAADMAKKLAAERVRLTEAFLRKTMEDSAYLRDKPAERDYRVEHSYRVANIGRRIALAEGFDPQEMTIACLLHDIAYCQPMETREERREHGRASARLARPFLATLGLPEDRVEDICFGIAIHVDDHADFEGVRTAFAETVSDADNIDRFDAYRIYEGLDYAGFRELPLAEKRGHVASTLENLTRLQGLRLATQTANALWQERLAFYRAFHEKLQLQLDGSDGIL